MLDARIPQQCFTDILLKERNPGTEFPGFCSFLCKAEGTSILFSGIYSPVRNAKSKILFSKRIWRGTQSFPKRNSAYRKADLNFHNMGINGLTLCALHAFIGSPSSGPFGCYSLWPEHAC